jgi:hypothetical protein
MPYQVDLQIDVDWVKSLGELYLTTTEIIGDPSVIGKTLDCLTRVLPDF